MSFEMCIGLFFVLVSFGEYVGLFWRICRSLVCVDNVTYGPDDVGVID